MSGPGGFILSCSRRSDGGEQGSRFQLVVEGTLDMHRRACCLLETWPTQASSVWGDGAPHPEPQHAFSALSKCWRHLS